MSDLEWCYRVLELKPGASLEEVNQAYKDLVFIWHPDRIPKDNVRLQQKALEKLQQLNDARDRLRTPRSEAQPTRTRSYGYQPYPRPHEAYTGSQQSTRSTARASQQATRPPQQTARSTAQTQPKSSHQSAAAYESSPYPHSRYYPPTDSARQPARPAPAPEPPPRKPDPGLTGADLQGADLKEKDFAGRNLSGANLSGANLSDAFLHRVSLQEANLSRANLFRANLLEADLRKANLREANLIGADLSGADLRGADLSGAKIGSSDRVMVKLTGARLTGTILPDGSVHA